MNIIDTHVHSNFSFDGEHSPREMIEKAIELGLYALTFTDHIDVSNYYSSYYKQSELMPLGAAEIPPLIEEYADRIRIGFGAELGQFMHEPALAEKLIADFGFDFVIGSIHEVREHEDFYYLDYHSQDIPKLLRLYFAEMLETAQHADVDVLGHLTYFLRYITGRDGIAVDLTEYTENIREIFKAAVGRGIGLEINTGGLRKQGYGRADPGLEHVKMFKEAGGEIITIGSDAHRTSDLAADFREGAEIAKAAGFRRIAYFEKRKPVFVDIM
ncbi:MAG: histidinol-phosphatase HisJ family protein [Oscillospiraceae bacterium]|nr:histidinol-phosphatase HisJ family protein [Oscillospiraceae bacterium]